jgi:hypothetical protein
MVRMAGARLGAITYFAALLRALIRAGVPLSIVAVTGERGA